MGKPRDLANVVATGNILADGAVAPAELTGVTSTAAEINILDGVTATAAELNLMDGVTATTAELNYVDGVTSNVQTQMNTKAPVADPTFTGTLAAPTINASTALQIGGAAITATAAELNIMDGVTASTSDINGVAGINSNVQTQLNLKAPIDGATFTGTTTIPTADINGGAIDGAIIGANSAAAVTATTLNASTKLQVNGTDVITNARALSNITSIDATTAAAIGAGGVGGGGTTELTAAAALSAGQAVVVNTSGQAAGITKTVGTIAAGVTSAGGLGGGATLSHAAGYDEKNDRLMWIGRWVNNSNQMYWGHAIIDESTGEYNAQGDSVWLSNTNYGESLAMSVDTDCSTTRDIFLVALRYSASNETQMKTIQFGSTNFNSRQNTGNSLVVANNPSSDGSAFAMVYDPSLKAHILITALAGAANAASVITIFTLSDSGFITNRGQATIANSTGGSGTFYKYPKIATNGSGQFVFTLGDSDATTLWAFPMTVTGSIAAGFTITQGTKQAVTTANFQGNANKHSVIFDVQSGKFVFDYRVNGPDSSLSVRSGTVSSNAITLHTEASVATSNVTGHSVLVADKNAESGLFTSGGYNNAAFDFRPLTVASNGNITVGSATALSNNANSYFHGDGNFHVTSSLGNKTLSSYTVIGVGNNGTEIERNHHKRTVDSDSSDLIGFTTAAINSGSAGDITVIGGVNDQQSGLTTGSKHYAGTGGELSTDSTGTYVGRALSATKLLVKG